MLSRMTVITPPLWHPNNPFCGPSNWVPPVPGGIIGGDYDLYPNFPSKYKIMLNLDTWSRQSSVTLICV